ncbi:MAG: cytochrome C assembly protein [Bacteroidetes bacterium HGW-Bacteroidetes-21]|jgi:ABC-type transport system involved in cytochrome c biogenesis permease subunit|nr:MAG: cytochrome C assembly protein [Bacteroidetes bacterium HGW-Bacteroidetes-21]
MSWNSFPIFSFITLGFWVLAIITMFFYNRNSKYSTLTQALMLLGIISLATFTSFLWVELQRPPMRTLGETRLWYALFMPVIGYIVLIRWKYVWFAGYCLLLASVFVLINLLKPEIHDKTLMPALQSIWFVPHVIVYIISYSLLGASTLAAIVGLYMHYRKKDTETFIRLADNLVYIGFGFLTLGLVFGALWAKQAWGHYWTWDPKETWALITWLGYLVYMHIRHRNPHWKSLSLWILALTFMVLLMCWFGMNLLPAAQNSVHVYAG